MNGVRIVLINLLFIFSDFVLCLYLQDEQLRKEDKTRKRKVSSMLEEHNYTIDSIGYEVLT